MGEIGYARKYRPYTLEDYMGIDIKKRLLSRLADEKNFPQVFLFYGTRGGGKTTLARLVAKEYLCLDRKDGHACGECQMCKMIDEELIGAEFGASTMGVREINVGTDGGKDDIEELMDEMLTPPLAPLKYKVIILDECHMLTPHAQNALLKVLEEPPTYLCIILATTNPEKLLEPVYSRCQYKEKIRPANIEELTDRMLYICQQEGIQVQKSALRMIAKVNDNNPRESLTMLENVAKNNSNKCTLENVMRESGSVANDIYMEYYRAANKGIEQIISFTNQLSEKDIRPREFIKGLIEFTMECMKIKYGLLDEMYSPEYLKAVKEFFKSYYTEDLDCLLQILEYASKMIYTDESMGELIISTTAMRIGKIKLLSVGLQDELSKAIKENEKGTQKAVQMERQELVSMRGVSSRVDDALISATFGANVKEVKAGPKPNIITEVVAGEEKDDDRHLTDEELLDIFGR